MGLTNELFVRQTNTAHFSAYVLMLLCN